MPKSRVVGASRLRRKLKRMPDAIQDELRGVIQSQGEIVLNAIRDRAPVSDGRVQPVDWEGKPRPHLRDALELRISKDGLRARIGLLGKRVMKVFFFARFLEFGTRFMEKRPFIFPAWRAHRPKAREAIVEATKKALVTVATAPISDA